MKKYRIVASVLLVLVVAFFSAAEMTPGAPEVVTPSWSTSDMQNLKIN